MEEKIINKLRNIKEMVNILYKNKIKEIDFEGESMIDSDALEEIINIVKIDEKITEIMYALLDSKNS